MFSVFPEAHVGFQTSFFDVPLHQNLHNASKDDNYDLRKILNRTILNKRPEDAVTFVDNHELSLDHPYMNKR